MQIPASSAADLQSQFLTLLVTQLQNQDPIEPVKQENFISQLAQFSTVEGLEKLSTQFEDVLRTQEILAGFDLVGKQVKYQPPGTTDFEVGKVSEAFLDGSVLFAVINGETISISQIVGVVA